MKTEKLTNMLLWVLMGISAVVFLAFYVVGFGETANDAPVTMDILLIWCLALIVLAFIAWVVSRVIFAIKNGFNMLNVILTWGLPILFLIPGFLIGMSEKHDPIEINGKIENVYYQVTDGAATADFENYNRAGDIMLSDTIVWAAILMLLASLGAILFSFIKGLKK